MSGVTLGQMVDTGLLLMALAMAAPGFVTVLHLAVLAVASIGYRERLPATPVPAHRLLVVVPAHNEELVLGRTLDAIVRDARPGDLLMVVDDRSVDRTADIAESFGALVVRRHPDAIPGRAAARQTALERAVGLEWDAMVMIDADSIIEPGFFDACDRMLSTPADALQVRSEAAVGERLLDQAALVSFAVQGVLMPRGRDRLGLLVRLRGTGMVLRREVVDRFEFRAPASEDLVYSLDLCRAGVRVRHVDSARMRSQNAGSWSTATEQKLRYEAGRMAAAREFALPLLRSKSMAGVEAATFLVSPPIATAAACLTVAGLLAAIAGASWLVGLTAIAALVLVAVVALAIREARLGPRVWLAIAAVPGYLVWKVFVQIRAAAAVRRRQDVFGATPRHGG